MAEQHGKAGQGARDLAEKRRLARLKQGPALALCLLALAGLAFCAAKPGLVVLALPGVLLARLWFQRLDAKLDRSRAEEKRALRGAKGEEKVADLLAQLGEGYAVYHDLPSPYGNIDHLVLSRTRGLFLIETKAHGGRVQREGEDLLINGKPPEKDFLAQVHRNRCWLRDELQRRLGCPVGVHGLLVFANAFVERVGYVKGVKVLPGRFLLSTLRQTKTLTSNPLWEHRHVLAELFPGLPSPTTAKPAEMAGTDGPAQPPAGADPTPAAALRPPGLARQFGQRFPVPVLPPPLPHTSTGEAPDAGSSEPTPPQPGKSPAFNRRTLLGCALLFVTVAFGLPLMMGAAVLILLSSAPHPKAPSPLGQQTGVATAAPPSPRAQDQTPYNPDLDNLYKSPQRLEAKYGKDQIAPYERAQYDNGFLGLVRGAAHARYVLKDYTITVAYLEDRAVAIRYKRHSAPFEMDDYELERILAANSGGLQWHLQPKDILTHLLLPFEA
jgi:hypothetical protein